MEIPSHHEHGTFHFFLLLDIVGFGRDSNCHPLLLDQVEGVHRYMTCCFEDLCDRIVQSLQHCEIEALGSRLHWVYEVSHVSMTSLVFPALLCSRNDSHGIVFSIRGI